MARSKCFDWYNKISNCLAVLLHLEIFAPWIPALKVCWGLSEGVEPERAVVKGSVTDKKIVRFHPNAGPFRVWELRGIGV